jgi:hypothetical protein
MAVAAVFAAPLGSMEDQQRQDRGQKVAHTTSVSPGGPFAMPSMV